MEQQPQQQMNLDALSIEQLKEYVYSLTAQCQRMAADLKRLDMTNQFAKFSMLLEAAKQKELYTAEIEEKLVSALNTLVNELIDNNQSNSEK